MGFWTHEARREYKDDERWAKLRVKRDRDSDADYFDVLIGKTGADAHVHMGIALDQTLLFAEYRDLVRQVGKKIESQQQGLLEDGHKVINPNAVATSELVLVFNINPSTGQTTIRDFGLSPVGNRRQWETLDDGKRGTDGTFPDLSGPGFRSKS
jgi:hypothetical protein